MCFVAEDKLKSWYYFLSTLTFVILAYSGTYLIPITLGKVVSALLAGLLTARLFVIYHDFHHEAILRGSAIAKILMTAIGLLTLAPSSIWNETHQHHHTHNSKFSRLVIGSFPTLSTTMYMNSTSIQRTWYLTLRHPLMILFAYVPVFLISFCFWPFFENPKKYADCGVAVIFHGMIILLLYSLGGFIAVFCSVLLPCTLMFALGAYIFYAQHNFSEAILADDSEWNYMEAALKSSSFVRMNRAMRWFTANIGYHHIHHVNCRIPFYRLPEAMNNLPELQQPRSTSLHPVEIWNCLKLKLWDEEQGKLITLKEFKSGIESLKVQSVFTQ